LIGVDSNVLIYAHRADTQEHDAALGALSGLISGGKAWGIPWPCVNEFLAVVTRPKYFKEPTPMSIALTQVSLWAAVQTCELLNYTKGHLTTLAMILAQTKWVGQKIYDAGIASICLDNQVDELWSADDSFADVQGLKVFNPLRP